jgi:hypothetical protein
MKNIKLIIHSLSAKLADKAQPGVLDDLNKHLEFTSTKPKEYLKQLKILTSTALNICYEFKRTMTVKKIKKVMQDLVDGPNDDDIGELAILAILINNLDFDIDTLVNKFATARFTPDNP